MKSALVVDDIKVSNVSKNIRLIFYGQVKYFSIEYVFTFILVFTILGRFFESMDLPFFLEYKIFQPTYKTLTTRSN